MWILTNFGAFMPALRPPETVAEGDDRVIQIRARRWIDLRRLRRDYMPGLGKTYSIPNSDYQYRADCTREDLAAVLVRLAEDIDYVSFKDTTIRKYGDRQLHDAYMSVWAALQYRLSPRRRPRGRARRHADHPAWNDPTLLETNWSRP